MSFLNMHFKLVQPELQTDTMKNVSADRLNFSVCFLKNVIIRSSDNIIVIIISEKKPVLWILLKHILHMFYTYLVIDFSFKKVKIVVYFQHRWWMICNIELFLLEQGFTDANHFFLILWIVFSCGQKNYVNLEIDSVSGSISFPVKKINTFGELPKMIVRLVNSNVVLC